MNRNDYLFHPPRFADPSVLRPLTAPLAFARTVERFPNRLAVVDGPTRLTWAELAERVRAFAAALQALGIAQGDVVALHLPNSWEFVVAHLAVSQIGAVSLPQHVPYREAELRTYLGHTEAKAIVGYAEAAQRMLSLLGDLPHLQTVVVTGPATGPALGFAELLATFAGASPQPVDLDPNDPFALFSTSGTESLRAKVCIATHGGFLSNSHDAARLAGASERDVLLSLSGFTHAFGISAIHYATLFGTRLVCLPKYDPLAFLDLVERESVTIAWAVAAQLSDITSLQRARGGSPPATLREVRTGGAPITPGLADDVRTHLCPNLVIQYGMSELGCALVTRHDDPPEAAATLGMPLDGAQIRIVEGELWYRRACAFRGYYRDPETTAATVTEDGWIRTGDLVTLDPSGRIVYAGRAKDIINRGGMKVSAFELEALLAALPGVRQLAIVRLDDQRLGERACVVCSLHRGRTITLEEITAFLAERGVAKYKWPEQLIVLDALPTTPTGKVAKSALRELVAARGVLA